jgi:hypothetical protein
MEPQQETFPAPREGFVLSYFVTSRDVARSAAFYRDVLGGEIVLEGEPTAVKLANGWIIINVGGGPTGGAHHEAPGRPQRRRRRDTIPRSAPAPKTPARRHHKRTGANREYAGVLRQDRIVERGASNERGWNSLEVTQWSAVPEIAGATETYAVTAGEE